MYFRTMMIFLLALFFSGCATSVKKEVAQLQNQVSQSQNQVQRAKRWQAENTDVFNGSYCRTPERGAEPKFSCHSANEAQNTALARCAIAYKGCDVVLSRFGNELDSDSKKFLASQICEAKLASLLGESRSAGDVVFDSAMAVADHQCRDKEGWLIFRALGCVYSATGSVIKFAQFTQCVSEKRNLCISNYQNWLNTPARRKAECETSRTAIVREEANIRNLSYELAEKQNSFLYKYGF